jgi:hypothetical protein
MASLRTALPMMTPAESASPRLELELDVERHVAEVAALEADVRPFPVVQPRHVVRRTDVHALRRDALVDLARHRLRLRQLLDSNRSRSSMFLKSMLPPKFS